MPKKILSKNLELFIAIEKLNLVNEKKMQEHFLLRIQKLLQNLRKKLELENSIKRTKICIFVIFGYNKLY